MKGPRWLPASLSGRLLAAVSALLLLFFGITIVLLETAFRRSAEAAIRDRLDVQLTVLVAAAEPAQGTDGGIEMPASLPEARFETPGSGLYGQINNGDGDLLWHSASAIGGAVVPVVAVAPGQRRFTRTRTGTGEAVFALTLGVYWALEGGGRARYAFTAAEHLAPFLAEVRGFRNALFGWFALVTVALIGSMALLLRRLLRPLRRVEREIVAIEQGRAATLGNDYPRELAGVTANLNALLTGERERLARYRDTLGNLAHSLKTPIAVMRNGLGSDTPSPAVLREQLDLMQRVVSHQLQRAAAKGATTLGQAPVAVAAMVNRLGTSLAKVHAGKAVVLQVDVPAGVAFYGDEDDLMEVLGNLMDNAHKWARSRVRVSAAAVAAPGRRRPGVTILVEDDGTGIDADEAHRLTARGVRADERVDGHGIGLSIVADIVTLYGGSLTIGAGALGGTAVEVTFDAS